MTQEQFNRYWEQNREKILMNDPEYRDARNNMKMSSGADWIFFALPAVCAILFLQQNFFASELLNWLCAAVITVLSFALCVWLKTILGGQRSLTEIENDIRKRLNREWVQPE